MADAEPGWHGMAALHPAKDPRYGTKIVQTTTGRPARWPGTNLSVFHFIYRSRSLEIDQRLRVVGDMFSVVGESMGGHGVHSGRPARLTFRSRAVAQSNCFQAGGNHQFQIPLSQYQVRVLPVQDLALLGDTNLPGEVAGRLADDGGVGGSSATADGTATAVKEAEFDVTLTGGLVKLLLRFIKFPGAG